MKMHLLTMAAVCAIAIGAAARQPNVVFIVVDDLGWRDTGCYGSTFYKTPNVDRLAATGMRFTQAYSANPLCSATRASIMSGRYPVRTGFTGAGGHLVGDLQAEEIFTGPPEARSAGPTEANHLPLELYTLGEAMKDAGYATSFFGKWHMGSDPYIPENNGFDYVLGGRANPGPPGPGHYFPPWNNDTLQPNPPADTHIDDYLGEKAVDYINEHKDEPFFMCFWLYDVHTPFQCKPELIEKWKKRTAPGTPYESPTLAAMIEVMDDNVGRVLDALDATGTSDDTIVIFTSDNGGNMFSVIDGTTPSCNLPLRGGKGNNYEGGERIPLIVRWPGVTESGSLNASVVSSVDHYPAILQMVGQALRPQDHKDGVSYVPALNGKLFDRGPTLSAFTHYILATMNIPNTSVRDEDWKLYRFWFDGSNQTHRYELYNLRADPGEKHNIAARHPERVRAMEAAMEAYYGESGSLKPNANQNYNTGTVGVWVANEHGKASAVDGALSMRSEKDQFSMVTRVVPNLVDGAVLEFDARSPTSNHLSIQWTSSVQKKFGQPQMARAPLSRDWKKYRVELPFSGFLSQVRFVLRDAAWQADVRNVRLLTPEGTLMVKYEFY